VTDHPQRKRQRPLTAAAKHARAVALAVQLEVTEAIAKAAPYAHIPIDWSIKTVEGCTWDDRRMRWLLPTAGRGVR
jgi:hypothetical protein